MVNESLSAQGEQRRHKILALASSEARRVRSRRMFGRVVLSVLPVGIAALVFLRIQPAMMPAARRVVPVVASVPPAILQTSNPIQYVQTDSTITDRLTLPPVKPRWTSINDQELLDELAAAGKPAGIVCLNGKTFLLSR